MRGDYRWFRFGTVLGPLAVAAALLQGCALQPRPTSHGHLGLEQRPAQAPGTEIPKPVAQVPILPPPKPAPSEETYTIVVDDVPVRELLFALARDSKKNVDISPKIQGRVTLNAVDQTLPQILERVARQVDIRYEVKDDTIVIQPDTPYLQSYKVDYVNISRDSQGTVSVATQVATTGSTALGGVGAGGGAAGGVAGGGGGVSGGGNNSTTTVTTTSNERFWDRLTDSLRAILAAGAPGGAGSVKDDVVANPEAGIVTVRATQRQQNRIRAYLDQVLASVRRQVLVEATIVEVTLNDQYQAGIDFSKLIGGGGVLSQNLLGNNLSTAPVFLFKLANSKTNPDISLTVKALKQFGGVRVLSSPKIMVLNNQTALFKVVENQVFFTVESSQSQAGLSGNVVTSISTTPHTVPVGLVMAVTPEISDDGTVTLNVRPTITRTVGEGVRDPNPQLQIPSFIPQIEVRELESVLKLQSGQIAVLGGLMQDEVDKNSDGVPVLSDLPGVFGDAFKYRNDTYNKTELVIFLRTTVIRNPSVEADLHDFDRYLPGRLPEPEPLSTLPQESSQ